jgi:hypothetical protein
MKELKADIFGFAEINCMLHRGRNKNGKVSPENFLPTVG